ncbi:MAG: VOC family protein, partial [Gammaproteobacteria bacterium]
QDRAVSFYTEKVGLKVVQDAPYQDGWRWIELEIPGAETRLMLTKRKDKDETDAARLVLITKDANETYQELVQKGVNFTKEPTQSPWNPGER